MKIIAETDNYAVIKIPDVGNQGHSNWEKAMESMMKSCEDLLSKGYRPLHYVVRVNGWFCEKQRINKAA